MPTSGDVLMMAERSSRSSTLRQSLSRRSDTGTSSGTVAGGPQGTGVSSSSSAQSGMGLSQSSVFGVLRQWPVGDKMDEGIVSECTICLEPLPRPAPRSQGNVTDLRLLAFAPNELAAPACGHIYHRFCLENWFLTSERRQRKTCPICVKDSGTIRRVFVGVGSGINNSKGGPRTAKSCGNGNCDCEECPGIKKTVAELRKKYEDSNKAQEAMNKKCAKLTLDLSAVKKELEALQKIRSNSATKINSTLRASSVATVAATAASNTATKKYLVADTKPHVAVAARKTSTAVSARNTNVTVSSRKMPVVPASAKNKLAVTAKKSTTAIATTTKTATRRNASVSTTTTARVTRSTAKIEGGNQR